MSGGSVLAHMTDANDDADEEMAQQDEQKVKKIVTTPLYLASHGVEVMSYDESNSIRKPFGKIVASTPIQCP